MVPWWPRSWRHHTSTDAWARRRQLRQTGAGTYIQVGLLGRSSAKNIEKAERKARVVALRRDQKLTLRQIAARVGCGAETVRRDINRYMAELDAACLEGAAALRAEEYERLDKYAALLEKAIEQGDLNQVPAAVKTSESLRRLYALDVMPLGRSELAMRRAVITEIATKLRDQLPPETFAEVAVLLTEDEPIQLLGCVATPRTDEAGTPPARRSRSRSGAAEGPGLEAPDGLNELGSGGGALPVVVSN